MSQAIPTVAVVVGSARTGSINQALARALARLADGRLSFTFVRIDDLPMFNGDFENDPPETVWRFKREIEAADAVLFVTPEYNRSVPALLKNAIDWGSRPWGKNSWAGKPGAVIGATPGQTGVAAAQQHLRNIVSPLQVLLLTQPEAYVQLAPDAIDADDRLTNEGQRQFLQGFVDAFAAWVDRLAPAAAEESIAA